jgi:hypothetical protein
MSSRQLESWAERYEIFVLCSRVILQSEASDVIVMASIRSIWQPYADREESFSPSNSEMGTDYLDGCDSENGKESSKFSREILQRKNQHDLVTS